jgi:hypothetical protein
MGTVARRPVSPLAAGPWPVAVAGGPWPVAGG